jgi:hypothetical protein
MSTLEMAKLKGILQDTVIALGKGNSVSSGAVIEAVRQKDPRVIELVSRQLEDGMMHRVLSQLATRRPKDHDGQPDMFSDYSGIHQFIGVQIKRDGHFTTEWKSIEDATIRELGAWLSTDRRSSSTRRQRERGMAKLFRDASKAANGSMDMTVKAAMALKKAHGGR